MVCNFQVFVSVAHPNAEGLGLSGVCGLRRSSAWMGFSESGRAGLHSMCTLAFQIRTWFCRLSDSIFCQGGVSSLHGGACFQSQEPDVSQMRFANRHGKALATSLSCWLWKNDVVPPLDWGWILGRKRKLKVSYLRVATRRQLDWSCCNWRLPPVLQFSWTKRKLLG